MAGRVLIRVHWHCFAPTAAMRATPAQSYDGRRRNATRLTSRPHQPPLETEKWGCIMTACTQPGCTGTIVDDYCNVCGSPAGAPPFIPTEAASAPSAAAAGKPGLTTGSQRPGFPPAPQNGLKTACGQPGCTGTIVDDYCNVCGSPAGAPPFIPARAAARQPKATKEKRPTQRMRRVQVTTQPSPTQETADPATPDAGTAEVEKLIEEKADPAAVRQELSMALGSPSIGDMGLMIASIRSGTAKVDPEKADRLPAETGQADTEITEPTPTEPRPTEPVDTEITEPTPTEPRPTEPVDTEITEPTPTEPRPTEPVDTEAPRPTEPVDTVPVDTEQTDPTAADTEKKETAPNGPDHPDTVDVEMPPVGAVLSGGQSSPQRVEQPVNGPVLVENPAAKKRFGYLALAATIVAALLIGALLFANRDGGDVTAQSDATVTATGTVPASRSTSEPSDATRSTGRNEPTIQLEDLSGSAMPFEAVRIQGTYRGGAGTFLRLQRWEGDKWLDFPLPTKTDESGRFVTQAEFGQPGQYRLRVLDPDSGVTSKSFVIVVKG
jgi:hypothetical protein